MIDRTIIRLAVLAVSSLACSSIALAQEPSASSDSQPATTVGEAVDDVSASANDANANEAGAGNSGASEPSVDSDSDDKLKDLLSLVQDNTLNVHQRENPAYFTLMKKVLDRSPEQLRNEVTLNPRFNDLYKKPSDYRGQLVHVSLNARRILPVDLKTRNVAGVTRLYEIWGWTEEAKAWMYCCVVPELPEGFPEAGDIAERIELTGYFFKMQAYQPGNADPNARNLVAPLVIGRIVNAEPLAKKADDALGSWPLILIIGFASIVMFRLMMHLRGMGRTLPARRNYRRRSLEPLDADAIEDALGGPDRGLRIRNANEV